MSGGRLHRPCSRDFRPPGCGDHTFAANPELGIYPAIDPLHQYRAFSTLRSSATSIKNWLGVQKILQRYNDLQDIIAILGIDELSKTTKSPSARARRIQRFFSQPFFVAEQFTGRSGKYVKLPRTIASFKLVLEGKVNDLPEAAFFYAGHARPRSRRTPSAWPMPDAVPFKLVTQAPGRLRRHGRLRHRGYDRRRRGNSPKAPRRFWRR